MTIRKKAVRQRVRQFEADVDRTVDLFNALVKNGHPWRRSTRRNRSGSRIDEMLPSSSSAKFKSFMQDMFVMAVRRKYGVSPSRAEFIMGHPERGLSGLLGWGSVQPVQQRARNLFGNVGFLAQLKQIVGELTFSRLTLAHTLRNRVAHDTADVKEKYRKALASLGVPKKSRQGAGVGRVLIEYPLSASEMWFHRFVRAYRRVATEVGSRL